MPTRRFLLAALGSTALLLGGCAGLNSVTSYVSSFGEWPAERRMGTFAFERLPSQQAQADQTERLEIAALPAIERAGFSRAAEGTTPDVLIQVGARVQRQDPVIWADPLWWRGGWGPARSGMWVGPGPWGSPGWGGAFYHDFPRYEREVAVLIRDRATGKPLVESRAVSDGTSGTTGALLAAMFSAALLDFPRTGINPRQVTVQLPG